MTITVEFKEGEHTRWIVPELMVREQIEFLMGAVARHNTLGPVPQVTVTRREDTVARCEGCGCDIVAGSQWCPKCGERPAPMEIDAAKTCKRCDELGWPTKPPLVGVDGQTLCWAHASLKKP